MIKVARPEPKRGGLTPIDLALEHLLSTLPEFPETETIESSQACGRVLAADCVAAISMPPQANSAMDGYALRSADASEAPASLIVSQRIPAGKTGVPLEPGQAARIFTGAGVPEGADAVVMQENTEVDGERLTVLQAVRSGENLRPEGEDFKAGAVLLKAGHRLLAQDVGLLAAAGIVEIEVARTPRVAIMATGDELVTPGTKLKAGQIYNSNAYSLVCLLQSLGVEPINLGIIADDPDATDRALRQAAEQADCIISTGGVSVGEEDHVKAAIEKHGHLDLWKLAIKPGKPFASGKVHGKQFFGLPGNPVSSFVTFVLLVRPALLQLQGCSKLMPLSLPVAAGFSRPVSGSRQEYLRVCLQQNTAGRVELQPYVNQSSGVAASLSGADGLAIIPPQTPVAEGDMLSFLPFSELLN